MSDVKINGHEYDIRLFVFDKDGLMFESGPFWIELAQARIRAVEQKYPEISKKNIKDWMQFVGVSCQEEMGKLKVLDVNPLGILAIASVPEEIIASAAYFVEHWQMDFLSARAMAANIFETGDIMFNLADSLKPRSGFPNILHKLREAQIPYGVATSDTKERVRESFELYDDFDELSFVVTLDDVEKGKPDPDMLLLIQKKTGIPMKNIAMVGDSYVDVAMARAAGAVGIGIPVQEYMRQKMLGVADEIVESLEDILI